MTTLTRHAGRVGVLMDKLHVLHQHLAAHAQLVADRAAAGVRAPDHVLVLQMYFEILTVTNFDKKFFYKLKKNKMSIVYKNLTCAFFSILSVSSRPKKYLVLKLSKPLSESSRSRPI